MNQLASFKAGYVALVGRPNVGKSTLLNCLLGEKLSIISPKPQTTRWQILGIKTLTTAQIIYVDTPGMHEDKRAINRYMNRVAHAGMMEADVVVVMIDATRFKKEDEQVLNKIASIEKPVILALNKVDLVKDKLQLLPLITKLHEQYKIEHIVPLSAKNADNTAQLEKLIMQLLPEGTALFPEDQLTDKTLRFQLAEIIREKLILVTGEELPYTTTVAIEEFKQSEQLTEIGAVIWVERTGQKIIVIGRSGTKLKKVGIKARREIENLLDTKVFLRLWVKVKENWTDDEKALRNLGYE